MTRVLNLATGEWLLYSCPPRVAVRAAHAQDQGDWQSWRYEERYDGLIREGSHVISCGDFTTRRESTDAT